MVNNCLGMMTDAWCEDGYQSDKNDHSTQYGRSVHHGCKRNDVHEEDLREALYPCQQVICVSRS